MLSYHEQHHRTYYKIVQFILQQLLIDGPGSALKNYFPFRNVHVRGLENDEILRLIPRNVQIIGLGCMFSSNWIYVRELVKALRTEFPSVFIILGGEHVTGFPEFSLEQAPFDVAVLGEGEETVVELIQYLEQEKPLDHIKGIAFRDSSGPRLIFLNYGLKSDVIAS